MFTSFSAPSFKHAFQDSKCRRIARIQAENSYVDHLQMCLEHFKNVCIYCKVHGIQAKKCDITSCPEMTKGGPVGLSMYLAWKCKIWYTDLHGKFCFFCHVPQHHGKLHKEFEMKSSSCDYPDIVVPLGFAIFHHARLCSAVELHFWEPWVDLGGFMAWMNKKPCYKDRNMLNELFIWYCTKDVLLSWLHICM